jgi:hypothetical protein
MKARGWKWSQATVWSVEKGERPLRLAEAEDIRVILGTLWSLTMEDADTRVAIATRQMARADEDLREAVRGFLSARLDLKFCAEDPDVSTGIAAHVQDWLARDPVDVVRTVQLEDEIKDEADAKLHEALDADHGQHPEAS